MQNFIPGRFYGGSVQGQFSRPAVQPGASIIRKMGRRVLCSNLGSDKKVLERILIPGRFYGGRVRVIFLLSAAVQPGASIMRKMVREVLGSNPGPDRKSVRT